MPIQVPPDESTVYCSGCETEFSVSEFDHLQTISCPGATSTGCKWRFAAFSGVKECHRAAEALASVRRKKIFKRGSYHFLAYRPPDPADITIPRTVGLQRALDNDTLNTLARAFAESIDEAIVFLSADEDGNLRQWPQEHELLPYACDACCEFMRRGECLDIRKRQLLAGLERPLPDGVSFFLCTNGNGGIHLQHPIRPDSLFMGLVSSGTIRFGYEFPEAGRRAITDELNQVSHLLNNSRDDTAGRRAYGAVLEKYGIDLFWHDRAHKGGRPVSPDVLLDRMANLRQQADAITSIVQKTLYGQTFKTADRLLLAVLDALFPVPGVVGPETAVTRLQNALALLCTGFGADRGIFFANFDRQGLLRAESGLTALVGNAPDIGLPLDQIDISSLSPLRCYMRMDRVFFWEREDEYVRAKVRRARPVVPGRGATGKKYCNAKAEAKALVDDVLGFESGSCVAIPMVPGVGDLRGLVLLAYTQPTVLPSYLRRNIYRVKDVLQLAIRTYQYDIREQNHLERLSHDIREPSGHIFGRSQYFLSKLDKKKVELSVDGRPEPVLAQRLTRGLLDFSHEAYRIGRFATNLWSLTGKPSVKPHVFTRRDTVYGLLNVLTHMHERESKSKRLAFAFGNLNLVGQPLVNGDVLEEVFDNLISNAVKYSIPGTTIELDGNLTTASLTCTISNVTLAVNDGEIKEWFRPYSKGSQSSRLDVRGDGLGLAIVESLVARAGGSIRSVAGACDASRIARVLQVDRVPLSWRDPARLSVVTFAIDLPLCGRL